MKMISEKTGLEPVSTDLKSVRLSHYPIFLPKTPILSQVLYILQPFRWFFWKFWHTIQYHNHPIY